MEHNYDLQAVVSHIGTEAASGHYIACINTFAGWAIFDDANVRYVSETNVLKQQGYILFYQKRNNPAIVLTQVFHCVIKFEENVIYMVNAGECKHM